LVSGGSPAVLHAARDPLLDRGHPGQVSPEVCLKDSSQVVAGLK